MIEKTGVIEYPDFINDVSVYIGKLRDLFNFKLNQNSPSYKRGEHTEFVNILGVKGELIFSNYLHQNNIDHCLGTLLSHSPLVTCDMIVNGKRIDIKTIRADAQDLLVNKQAHEKLKGIDTYVFVQVQDNNKAQYWVHKYGEINDWKIKNVGYSDAYYKSINTK